MGPKQFSKRGAGRPHPSSRAPEKPLTAAHPGLPPGAAEPECSELFRGPKAMVSMTAQANQGPDSPLKNLLLLLL